MSTTDLTQCTAHELVQLYRTGQASPVEATQAVLSRIDRINPKINAFCLVDAKSALASARASEARWQAHRSTGAPVGELDGVPTSIKDLILTQGWPTLRGSRTVDPQQPWDVDAPATARLREAGAVLLGKTTTPEFGCKGETNSPATGITRNPWNLNHTPGGSSGGAAAAVAAGLGPLAVGTDGAGSVRIPAAFCGNVGLKPSFGRVPAYPLSPFGSVAHLGPHTLSVRDAAMMMNVLKKPDARDWTSLPPEASDYTVGLEDGIRGLRIAYSPTLGYAHNVHPDIAAAVDQAVQKLKDLGAHVEQVDPGFDDPLDITTGLWFLGAHTVWSGLSAEQQAVADPDFRAEAQLGAQLSAQQIQQLHQRRGVLGSHMRQFMQRYDLLVTPSVSIPAFEARPAGTVTMDPVSMLGWTPFSYPFNLTQQPAITVPCGLTKAGLPMGLQIVGPMFGDALVLRAARAYESVQPVARPSMG
ncbi:amidase [Limnohabitans sp. MMS-10A-160]|uniref:amidase n=1 Tax=unclassified Limnohabitans TaxID=2626134 RepID=UPI000D3CC91D|nr:MULTISPECIES: amidase [unclassified Limnohabitans]PUE18207.1 amidase [Limnohabitans sp. MMS-10A-192]PUE27518.1 amidase [Limnohabitans sp. MMS-10A-160]